MKRAWLIPLLIALPCCGGSEDRQQDMAKCRAYAARASDGDADNSARACMMRKGYHFNGVLSGCGDQSPYQTAACYTR
ncbi:MAG TPA: hypothetical protein VKS78_12830 [Roseiarcus sp.]|nr:hypothetical protein [Roseiarcus sp.]